MNPTPDDCRQTLSRLLQQETAAMEKLSTVLQAEREAILTRNTAALEQAVEDKKPAINRLLELEQERTRLVESAGYRTTPDGMQEFLQWCDSGDRLAAAWQQLLSLADACREQNLHNHRQAEISSRYIHEALCILRGEDPERNTYGPDGESGERHRSRSLVRA